MVRIRMNIVVNYGHFKDVICAEHEERLVEKTTAEEAANPGRCRERRERV